MGHARMLQTIRDACSFDAKAIEYALSDQVENLEDLNGHTPAQAEAFFAKTFVTEGMRTLLRRGLQRLGGGKGEAVFELKQAMGGGKTHSMLALGYLAANPSLIRLVPKEVSEGLTPVRARVVALSGRAISHDKHLWGDIATQLGEPERFVEFYRGAPVAPNEKDWMGLIGDKPTLILLDELPPYFANALTKTVGQGTLADVTTFAISNLLSAALKLKQLCIVVSNLSGSYEGATTEISALLGRATRDLQDETRRQGKPITPVELGSDEIYQILRKRLLSAEPAGGTIDAVATAFSEAISDAVKSKTIAKSATQIADEIFASYPFHPSFKHVVALFKDNQHFRQTRGVMTLAGLMVRSVQRRKTNDVYLVGCQHIDLAEPGIRDTVTSIYDLSGAIAHDIAGTGGERGHAQVIDEQTGTDAAGQVASLLLMASLPEASGAVKGLTKPQVVENLVAPHRSPHEFDEGFEKLRTECWYLHRRENEAWYFSKNENLKKKIDRYAEGAPQPKIDAELERRLKAVFEPKHKRGYAQVLALPKVEDIKPSGGRVLLVLSPDRKMPPEEAQRLFEAVPQKNNFCVVSGDGSDLGKLEDKVRRIWAAEKVRIEDGGDRSPNVTELDEELEHAEFEFNAGVNSLFNRVYFPARQPAGRGGLVSAALKLVPRQDEDGKAVIDGEIAVEEALASTGAAKLIVDVEGRAEMLRQRAEEQLWTAGDRRCRWKDIEEQAICNVRWPWLPPRGLETLKRLAIGTGDWRDNNDGYIERGPFPPAVTSVKPVTRSRDDSGNATIELTARNAGPNARIHVGSTPEVSEQSPIVEDSIIVRNETVLWFLAVDPDGKHQTGPPEKWNNTLSITYEPREVMGRRSVSLDVKPRGALRWNLDGTNVREGHAYTGPIDIPGDGEVTVYTYAEDAGVTETKSFSIRARTGGQAEIDPEKPATVIRRVKLATTADSFAVIRAGKKAGVSFASGVSVTVGKGDVNATTRFGPGSVLKAEAVEAFVSAARAAIGDELAEVELGFGELRCATGRELIEFLSELSQQITVDPAEVQQ